MDFQLVRLLFFHKNAKKYPFFLQTQDASIKRICVQFFLMMASEILSECAWVVFYRKSFLKIKRILLPRCRSPLTIASPRVLKVVEAIQEKHAEHDASSIDPSFMTHLE